MSTTRSEEQVLTRYVCGLDPLGEAMEPVAMGWPWGGRGMARCSICSKTGLNVHPMSVDRVRYVQACVLVSISTRTGSLPNIMTQQLQQALLALPRA